MYVSSAYSVSDSVRLENILEKIQTMVKGNNYP